MNTGPSAVHVVIPAHNEAETIGACLDSVQTAVDQLLAHSGIAARVTVVADSCTDATLYVAAGRGVATVAVEARSVGRARDAGARHALASDPQLAPSRLWVAMTDADSRVAPSWLQAQVTAASSGADLWVGRIEPDAATVPAAVLRAWWIRHAEVIDAPAERLHIHGANLGFTGAVYLAAGGFAPVAEHEDVAFVRAALAAGASAIVGEPAVLTSGRAQGRTPGGFAGYIRNLTEDLELA